MTALADLCGPDIERLRAARALRRQLFRARDEGTGTVTVNGAIWPLSALEAVLAWVEDGYTPDPDLWVLELYVALDLGT